MLTTSIDYHSAYTTTPHYWCGFPCSDEKADDPGDVIPRMPSCKSNMIHLSHSINKSLPIFVIDGQSFKKRICDNK